MTFLAAQIPKVAAELAPCIDVDDPVIAEKRLILAVLFRAIVDVLEYRRRRRKCYAVVARNTHKNQNWQILGAVQWLAANEIDEPFSFLWCLSQLSDAPQRLAARLRAIVNDPDGAGSAIGVGLIRTVSARGRYVVKRRRRISRRGKKAA